ncbi:MAG: hypothetical protein MJE12_06310 [Alphaproteobacteria bacterium]|nr:hypothetical protein [Alphaproteobacteria bacterium]
MTINPKQELLEMEHELTGRWNRILYKFSGFLGLTTGIGIIAWGVWSLVSAVGTFVYEETGVSIAEILINNGLNVGLLLSSIVIALGVIILELKKIQSVLLDGRAAPPEADDGNDAAMGTR